MKRSAILLVAIVAALMLPSGAAYAGSLIIRSHTVTGPPSWAGRAVAPTARVWSPLLGLAPSGAGTGVVQGRIYDYDGSPVVGAKVRVSDVDDEFNTLWYQDATTDVNGLYSVSGAPATLRGAVFVRTADADLWGEMQLTFTEPGPTIHDLRPGRVTWTVNRGGPWGFGWGRPNIEVAGASAAGTPVYAQTFVPTEITGRQMTGWASALPADARLAAFAFWPNEVWLWDMAEADPMDIEGQPASVGVGSTSSLPAQFHQEYAYRIFFTNSYWYSGRPGTVLRLAMENFKKGMRVEFDGSSEGPDGVRTTWGGKNHTSDGWRRQTVSLTVPAGAEPGYHFDVAAHDASVRYGTFVLGLTDYFQVCTLTATRTSVPRGAGVKLSGVVPVQGHEAATAGKPKYVWIYKRTTAASTAPRAWDATTKGWKLAAKVRTDGHGRYQSPLQRPASTTWYVARYAGDDWYWRAYTSVLRVSVR